MHRFLCARATRLRTKWGRHHLPSSSAALSGAPPSSWPSCSPRHRPAHQHSRHPPSSTNYWYHAFEPSCVAPARGGTAATGCRGSGDSARAWDDDSRHHWPMLAGVIAPRSSRARPGPRPAPAGSESPRTPGGPGHFQVRWSCGPPVRAIHTAIPHSQTAELAGLRTA